MPESSLNQILADNLALHMEKKGLKQMALAKNAVWARQRSACI
jgi:hypothetical protein